MTQEQFNFLEGFGAYLTRRGFRVYKDMVGVSALSYSKINDTHIACRIVWCWTDTRSSVFLVIKIGGHYVGRSLPTALLMDYEAGSTDLITKMIRDVMREFADQIVAKLICK